MRTGWLGQSLEVVAGVLIALSVTQGSAEAARHKPTAQASRSGAGSHSGYTRFASHRGRSWHPSWQRSALQCVPFARENSGIELSGNAGTWWNNATGLYERGARPEVGSILSFRATGHMRMGHVAVVTNVISPRHIEIDHANWGAPGRVSRNIDVVDVSEGNDWTAVRVALSQAEDYGSTYPTYGFIYDRPDHGVMVANNTPQPMSTPSPAASDLRLASDRINLSATTAPEEVAEATGDEDVTPTPRYSGRHRVARSGRASAHASSTSRQRGSVASTYKVSTRAVTVKPSAHKSSRRRL